MHVCRLLAVGLLGGVLAGCSQSEPSHDVAYYRDHPAARAAKLAACRNDQGKLAGTRNCINTLSADSEAVSKRFWDTPKPSSRVAEPGQL